MSKSNQLFSFFFIKEYLFRGTFLKERSSNFNFKIRLLLKPGPILDGAALRQFTKYNIFFEAHF